VHIYFSKIAEYFPATSGTGIVKNLINVILIISDKVDTSEKIIFSNG